MGMLLGPSFTCLETYLWCPQFECMTPPRSGGGCHRCPNHMLCKDRAVQQPRPHHCFCLHMHHRPDMTENQPILCIILSLPSLQTFLWKCWLISSGGGKKKKKNNGLVSVLAFSVSFVPSGIFSEANPTLDWLRRREANQHLIALPSSLISHRINFYGKSYGSLKCKGSYEAAYRLLWSWRQTTGTVSQFSDNQQFGDGNGKILGSN